MKLIAIYDRKAGSMVAWYPAPSLMSFARSLKDSPESIYTKHPEDFVLHDLGDLEDDKPVIVQNIHSQEGVPLSEFIHQDEWNQIDQVYSDLLDAITQEVDDPKVVRALELRLYFGPYREAIVRKSQYLLTSLARYVATVERNGSYEQERERYLAGDDVLAPQ